MDISEKYVLMCKAAEELREIWEWKEGDFYAGKVHTCRDPEFNKIEWPIEYGGVCSDDRCPNYRVNCGENWYSEVWPLPRVDQLQELIDLPWQSFYQTLYEHYWRFPTPERAGLKYIMMKKYGKTWDGEAWI